MLIQDENLTSGLYHVQVMYELRVLAPVAR